MVAILMMSAKLATLGLLKIKVFWNKSYYDITPVHDLMPEPKSDGVLSLNVKKLLILNTEFHRSFVLALFSVWWMQCYLLWQN